jgi:hypothetical protein
VQRLHARDNVETLDRAVSQQARACLHQHNTYQESKGEDLRRLPYASLQLSFRTTPYDVSNIMNQWFLAFQFQRAVHVAQTYFPRWNCRWSPRANSGRHCPVSRLSPNLAKLLSPVREGMQAVLYPGEPSSSHAFQKVCFRSRSVSFSSLSMEEGGNSRQCEQIGLEVFVHENALLFNLVDIVARRGCLPNSARNSCRCSKMESETGFTT